MVDEVFLNVFQNICSVLVLLGSHLFLGLNEMEKFVSGK
jgi:hypothetical protein